MGNACAPVCIKTKSSKVTNVHNDQDPAFARGSVCLVKTNTRIFSNYDIGNLLGKGTYGEVRGCIHKPTNLVRAVKIIKKKSQSEKYRQSVMQEFQILKTLDHMNILTLMEFYESKYHFYIISEQDQVRSRYMEGGELFEELVKRECLNESNAASIIQQVLSALAYCNLKGVVHRDIKPQNILLETKVVDGFEEIVIKLADFGLAKRLAQDESCPTHLVGSPLYMAPEVVKEECVNYKSDIWSLGVILYIMLTGCPPFFAENRKQLFELVKNEEPCFEGQLWGTISPEAKDMLKQMLSKNYQTRPSARSLLKHPWLKLCLSGSNKSKESKYQKSLDNSLSNLKKFNKKNQLYMASLTFITSQLVSSQEVKELREAFLQIDSSKDGQITREELIHAFKTRPALRRNFGDNEVDEIINAVDMDRNGVIDYTEFINATIDKGKALTMKNLQIAFNQFDMNGDGQISLSELKQALSGLQGDALVKQLVEIKELDQKPTRIPSNREQEKTQKKDFWMTLMEEVDSNKDGKISFDEFHTMISKCI